MEKQIEEDSCTLATRIELSNFLIEMNSPFGYTPRIIVYFLNKHYSSQRDSNDDDQPLSKIFHFNHKILIINQETSA